MSFRLRFALRFTLVLGLILLISFGSIYFIYGSFRQHDFSNRLSAEAVDMHDVLSNSRHADLNRMVKAINELHGGISESRVIAIRDSAKRVFVTDPTYSDSNIVASLFDKIQPGTDISEKYGDRQYIGMHFTKPNIQMIISGIDKPGMKRLQVLSIILLGVFAVALIGAVWLSFIFSNQVVKPILALSKQMEASSVVDLRKRIPENGEFAEVNLIAKNFNEMLVRLEKTFEFQRSFVHHASHELRTPLATMLSHTESALANRLTEEEYRIVLGSLRQDQERMIELTNSLLLISQFEQQGFDQSWPVCRIDEILYDKISINMKMFPDLSISLVFLNTPSSDDDLTIKGNEALLKSMFSNLIRNGYYYSTNKKVEILLEIADKSVMVHVDTKGEHLDETEREKIMMPFFRGNTARQKKTTGAGLGLTIVQRIINMHKGSLKYSAMPNQVNRFTVILPKAKDV
ncbi:MAG: ATP-binding protein [Sediminibacterium sp.]|nr:HAMP domain-containing sensor histidine kinase [uncultured Sediminibacterium sp.]